MACVQGQRANHALLREVFAKIGAALFWASEPTELSGRNMGRARFVSDLLWKTGWSRP